MQEKTGTIQSADGKLTLHLLVVLPEGTPKGIVQMSHGMSEHKERYLPFLEYLAENGYVAVIHDHRGHGDSVLTEEDYGYFYDDTGKEIVNDLLAVTHYVKAAFPRLPVYLFGHSMGTLVARNYIKEHDGEIEKLILCGPPSQNDGGVKAGMLLVHRLEKRFGDRYRAEGVDKLVFGGYNRKFHESQVQNRWVCSVPEEVERYNSDPKCGFTFTLNGFKNLFQLLKGCYEKSGWGMENPRLPILFLGGSDDPVIGGGHGFHKQITFLKGRGYENITGKLYSGKRHELLNEDNRTDVYRDILTFLQK